MYVSTLLLIRLDLSATLPHTASTGWIEPVLADLTNHNLCDMFYTLTKVFVYKLLLRVSQNSGHYLFFIFAHSRPAKTAVVIFLSDICQKAFYQVEKRCKW